MTITGSESKPSDGGSEQDMNTHNILLKKLLAANKEAAAAGKIALGPRYCSNRNILIDSAINEEFCWKEITSEKELSSPALELFE